MIRRAGAFVFLLFPVQFLLSPLQAPVLLEAEEAALLSEVNPQELSKHAAEIIKHVRPSGSPGEFAAIDYIVKTLRSEAIPVELFEFPAYVSDPLRCSLRIEAAGGRALACLTQALAAPTGPEGLDGEVVYCGKGTPEDYAGVPARGKVALVDALPYPWGVKAAEQAGAIGAIFASGSERVHELTVSPIWGTPTHQDYRELPRIPSVAIKKSDGEHLRELLRSGGVRVHIETEVDTKWKTLRLAVATIRSGKDPEGFVLLGGHIDAWHHGANDEGASNAAMVEMARLFYRHRNELERSLKVAWWPGHSNGRYAGSTWFTDHFWTELRDHALAYMNIDGLGQMGATVYGADATAEMGALARAVVKDVAKAELKTDRPGRNSDQCFFGIGLPLLQFDHRRTDETWGYWWWHTPEDTFDKIDFEILAGDTRLYVSALYRLLSRPVPPIDLPGATAELRGLLEERTKLAGSHLDISPALERSERLHNLALSLDERIRAGAGSLEAAELARRMVRFVRPLLRVTYQERGPYHQDPALNIPTLPGLEALELLGRLDPEGDLYRFTRTYLARELNRLLDHLDQALAEGEALAGELTSSTSAGVE